jgi:hypothetical protein
MTPADLPCKDGYRWMQFAGEWWCVPDGLAIIDAVAMVVSRRLVLPGGGRDLETPAEVQSYYSARPHVPCPFVFEVTP